MGFSLTATFTASVEDLLRLGYRPLDIEEKQGLVDAGVVNPLTYRVTEESETLAPPRLREFFVDDKGGFVRRCPNTGAVVPLALHF